MALGLDDRTISVNNTTVISGIVTGSQGFSGFGGIIKEGMGTLILSSSSGNTYSGGTTIQAGKLLLDNISGSALGSGPVIVNAGGRLGVVSLSEGGSGTASVFGPLTINSGGILKAGNSTGLLSLSGNLTLQTGSILEAEINGSTAGLSYSQIISLSSININNATLTLLSSTAIEAGMILTIIRNDSGVSTSGAFNGLPEGALIVSGVNTFQLTYAFNNPVGDGMANDVALTAVPEPVTVILFSGAMIVIGYYTWRQHRLNQKQIDTEIVDTLTS